MAHPVPLPPPFAIGVILRPGEEPQIVANGITLEQLALLLAQLHTAVVLQVAEQRVLGQLLVQRASPDEVDVFAGLNGARR